jgi:branched-chain amino acid transport system permease protein
MVILGKIIGELSVILLLLLALNNFVLGKSGILSVGHLAFYGIGMLGTGVLTIEYEWNIAVSLITSIGISLTLSYIVGLITFRLSGDFFLLVSVAFCEFVRSMAVWLTGPGGLSNPGIRFKLSLGPDWSAIVILVLPFVVLLIMVVYLIQRSPLDSIYAVMRKDEAYAQIIGIPPQRYKLGAFMIGASIAAYAGGVRAIMIGGTDPAELTLVQSILIFSMAILGGIDTLKGAVVGSIFLVGLGRLIEAIINHPSASFYAAQLNQLIWGVILVLVIRLRPQGVFGKRREF